MVPVPISYTNVAVLAWVGSDRAHSLNVLWDAYGAKQKLTLMETSPFAPALAYFAGQVWLSWAGTDANHTLNVLALGPHGLAPGVKTTLAPYHTGASPALATDTQDAQLLLTWENNPGTRWIDFAQSPDGVHWTTPLTATPQTSAIGPDLLAIAQVPSGMAPYYWAWQGTDGGHSINIQPSTALDTWAAPVDTLTDTSDGKPLLGYVGQAHRVLLVWTGTDPAHHLNVALVPMQELA
jgi:hypothetical protein